MKPSEEALVRARLLEIEAALLDLRKIFPRLPEEDEVATMERSCASKRRYSTPEGAGDAATQASAKSGDKLRVYACTFCKGYHLTKTALEDVAQRVAEAAR